MLSASLYTVELLLLDQVVWTISMPVANVQSLMTKQMRFVSPYTVELLLLDQVVWTISMPVADVQSLMT